MQNMKQKEKKIHYSKQNETEKWKTEIFIDLKHNVITNKKVNT